MDRHLTHSLFPGRRSVSPLVPLLAILIGGCAGAGVRSAAVPATSPAVASVGGAALDAPAVGQVGGALPPVSVDNGTAGSGTSSISSSGTAIAYPYPGFGGSAGLAPDHELVVSGTGWATVKADLSNRAAAQRTALAAALADAKSQAQAAASDAGVTLGGVISLSVSVGGNYIGVMATGASGPPQPAPAGGATTDVAPAPGGSAPTTEQLEVTVTVAYAIS